ncbi:MAG: Uma2 family endonuclease [bacterium]
MALRKEEYMYSYGDYLHWSSEIRSEIIDGEIYDMTPAPMRDHQEIAGELFFQIYSNLRDKPCRVFVAPFDVVLPETGEREEDAKTVVQPDIVVVCDKTKLTKRGCVGAPDMIIEVLSPRTATKDMTVKLKLYERFGVHELWLVHPEEKWVHVLILNEDGKYAGPQAYDASGMPAVAVLPGLIIELPRVFPEDED